MLSDIIEYASSRNLRTMCTTNGFCAYTYKYAQDKLLRLKDRGLSKIDLSVDHFHKKFLAIDNIKNILIACKKIGIPVDVGSVVTRSTSDLSELLFELRDYMIDVNHFLAACLPIGRAINIEHSDLYYDENLLKKGNIKCH